MSKVKLTYFGIEAAAEKVRLALVMCNKEFEDERIDFAAWGARKASTPYGQLPIMDIDGKVFAQSGAMMRWAARKYDGSGKLYPTDADQMMLVEEMIGLLEDMARAWAPALYLGMGMHQNFGHPEDWPAKADTVKALREKFLAETLPRFVGYFVSHIEKNGNQFLTGADVTIADLMVLAQLRYFTKGVADHVPVDSLEKYPAIIAYMSRLYEVPQIKAWYKM